eukprot:TRINITY_DN2382_c0_g2_i1.p1 TRINITY_DN2382_c0_g2~~TRINITY_DN2382_c0_g2_i1.p1  ORF type:complete len:500 (+),score=86.50 TRINITY_DN2382_c0_g2_i1:248-1747(+)
MGRGHTHLLSSSSLLLSVFLLIALEHVHEIEAGAVSTSVFERNLVTDKVDYRSILAENDRYWVNTSHRHFTGSVLGYVTPWNGKGYDIAKTFRAKFTHISPVWYQLRNGDNGGLVLTGSHDVDAGWIEAVRVNGLPRIVPRVVLEMDEVQKLLTQKSKQKTAIRLIVDECKLRGYDGIVFEAWFTWMAAQALESPDLRNKALLFLEQLGKALHATPVTHNSTTSSSAATSPRHLQLIFVIPPPHPKAGAIAFTNEDLTRLDPYLDGVSLMTYDFSNAHRPGFSAPITWVKSVLKFLLPSVKPKFGEWVYPTLYETDVEKEAEGEEDKKAEEAEKKRGEKEARVEEEEEEEEWEEEEEEEVRVEEELDYDGYGRHGRELKSFDSEGMAGRGGATGNLAAKVFQGLNFYGNHFILPSNGGPIVGHEYLALLERKQPSSIEWTPEMGEHSFKFTEGEKNQKHEVYFPTLPSIALRLREAMFWGTGVSIWEIGQGLDYFYDLL